MAKYLAAMLLLAQLGTSEALKVQVGDVVLENGTVPELQSWKEWKALFRSGANAYKTAAEEARRRDIFEANLIQIARHNMEASQGKHTWRQGVNHFSDFTVEEFKAMKTYKPRPRDASRPLNTFNFSSTDIPIPDELDWRKKGAVSKVKNQGMCGSCWAFSTTGALEGAFQIATGAQRRFSEQQLVDCARNGHLGGCNGGDFQDALDYVKGNGGLNLEDNYPYLAEQEACWKEAEAGHAGGMIAKYVNLPPNDGKLLKAAVAHGPVSIAIEADHDIFRQYKGGVISDYKECGIGLDHAVLVVGYTKDYWIVKNSWGPTWGEQGFVRIAIDPTHPKGVCGINMAAVKPIINKGSPVPPLPPKPAPRPVPKHKCGCVEACSTACQHFGMICCGFKEDKCMCGPEAACPDCKPESFFF